MSSSLTRCPNCEHTSGYHRRSSDDWRCRRCGYIWVASDVGVGGSGGTAVSSALPSTEAALASAGIAGATDRATRAEQASAVIAEVLSGELDLDAESVVRVLRERAASLAQEAETHTTGDRRLLGLFALGEEWYATDVDRIREIRREFSVTKVPGAPKEIVGVINLRGEIISATDLAKVLGVGEAAEKPVMMICDLAEVTTGLLVDQVADVIEVMEEAIEPPLATLERVKAEYTVGQVAVDDRLVTILDLDRVLAPVGA